MNDLQDNFTIIAVGPFAWGKALTVSEAVKNCKRNIAWVYVKGDTCLVPRACLPVPER